MATFAKGASSLGAFAHNASVRRKASSEAQTSPRKVSWLVDPSDALTLRGLPAIGRGVAGAIRGTSPGSGLP